MKKKSPERLESYAWFFDRYSEPIAQVRKGATGFSALEALYNWERKSGILGAIEAFWMQVRSAQALRNRKVIVVREIRQAVEAKIATEGEARILSIAAGAARPVFEAIQGMKSVKVLCIDANPEALDYSRGLAAKLGITEVEWKEGNALSPHTLCNGFEPNIVEVVGLFDYLSDRTIIGLLNRGRRVAKPGATLITAHIHPNPEEYMLRAIADWEMVYRTKGHFQNLLAQGGFDQARLLTEPHSIFTVAIGEVTK